MSSYIPSYLRNECLNQGAMTLWNARASRDNGQEYFKVEIYSDENYVEKDIDDILNMNTYKCYICNVDVPKTYITEHIGSVKHEINMKIANMALQRTQLHLKSDLIQPRRRIEVANSYFCDHCTTVVQNIDKDKHVLSDKHLISVKNCGLLQKLVKIYEEPDKDCDVADISVKDQELPNLFDTLAISEIRVEGGSTVDNANSGENSDRIEDKETTQEPKSETKKTSEMGDKMTVNQQQSQMPNNNSKNVGKVNNHNLKLKTKKKKSKDKPEELNVDKKYVLDHKNDTENNDSTKNEKLNSNQLEGQIRAIESTSNIKKDYCAKESIPKTRKELNDKESTLNIEKQSHANESILKIEKELITIENTPKTEKKINANESTSKIETELITKVNTPKTENKFIANENIQKTEKENSSKIENDLNSEEKPTKTEKELIAKENTSKIENETGAKESTSKIEKELLSEEKTPKIEKELNTEEKTPTPEKKLNAKEKTSKIETNYNESLRDLRFYLEIASFLQPAALNVTAHSEDSVFISAPNVERVRVPLLNFHGYTVTGQDVVCKICLNMKSVDVKKHKWNDVHMKKIMSPLKGHFRSVSETMNHCILCNKLHSTLEIPAHTASTEHASNLQNYSVVKFLSKKVARLALTNYIRWTHDNAFCKICKIQIPKNNHSITQHVQSAEHVNECALTLTTNRIMKVPFESGVYFCRLCQKKICPGDLVDHCEYSAHKKKLALSMASPNTASQIIGSSK